jgi:hypothetical protein
MLWIQIVIGAAGWAVAAVALWHARRVTKLSLAALQFAAAGLLADHASFFTSPPERFREWLDTPLDELPPDETRVYIHTFVDERGIEHPASMYAAPPGGNLEQ